MRVPFAQLCRSVQSIHNRGLAIDSVAFSYGSGEASAPTPAPVATSDDTPKTEAKQPAKAEAKKPAKRGGRRKRA